jgi:hypothetical protein
MDFIMLKNRWGKVSGSHGFGHEKAGKGAKTGNANVSNNNKQFNKQSADGGNAEITISRSEFRDENVIFAIGGDATNRGRNDLDNRPRNRARSGDINKKVEVEVED